MKTHSLIVSICVVVTSCSNHNRLRGGIIKVKEQNIAVEKPSEKADYIQMQEEFVSEIAFKETEDDYKGSNSESIKVPGFEQKRETDFGTGFQQEDDIIQTDDHLNKRIKGEEKQKLPVERLGVASFVLSILGLTAGPLAFLEFELFISVLLGWGAILGALIGLVLGIISCVIIKRNPGKYRRRWLAYTGVIISSLVIVSMLLAILLLA